MSLLIASAMRRSLPVHVPLKCSLLKEGSSRRVLEVQHFCCSSEVHIYTETATTSYPEIHQSSATVHKSFSLSLCAVCVGEQCCRCPRSVSQRHHTVSPAVHARRHAVERAECSEDAKHLFALAHRAQPWVSGLEHAVDELLHRHDDSRSQRRQVSIP